MKPRSRSSLSVLVLLLLPCAAGAKDLELSLSLGEGYPVKRNLYLVDNLGSGTSTFVQTQFSGPWVLGGVHVNGEFAKAGAWKFWAGAAYESGLGSPSYYKTGQSTVLAATSNTENLNGTAKYSRYQVGLGTTVATGTLGEYGCYLWRRSNQVKLDGTLSTFAIQGTSITSQNAPYALKSSGYDYMLELSMAFVQAQATTRTFERISLGTAFGPGYGLVGAANWQLDPAFADRLRPTLELSFSFGVRL